MRPVPSSMARKDAANGPKQPKKQALRYSGKKEIHSDKNIVIATVKRKRVSYLSQKYPGKTHDKKVADKENISYPKQMTLHKDTGFQGYGPTVHRLYQPKKARKKELTAREKERNR